MSRCACDRPLTRESAGPCNLSRSQTASTSSSKLTTRFKPAAALMSIRPLQQIPRGAPVPIVGISGASGVAYGIRLLQVLAAVAGMIVAPCSIKTVASVATCFSDNLLLPRLMSP